MNTGSKLTLASVALVASVTTLPAAAAPMFFQGSADVPFMMAGRDSGEFRVESNPDWRRQDEHNARKAEKQSLKKERANEPAREHESDQPGYGYGYERRYPVAPIPPSPRFDDRGRR